MRGDILVLYQWRRKFNASGILISTESNIPGIQISKIHELICIFKDTAYSLHPQGNSRSDDCNPWLFIFVVVIVIHDSGCKTIIWRIRGTIYSLRNLIVVGFNALDFRGDSSKLTLNTSHSNFLLEWHIKVQ